MRRFAFTRGRLIVGVVGVTILGAVLAFGLGRLRAGPDLGRLLYASERGVYLRELRSGDERRVTDLPRDTLDASPSPDGRWLAFVRRGGALWLADLESRRRWQLSERLTAVLAWTPSGRLVAQELSADRDVVAVDPDGRRPELLLTGFPGGPIVWLDEDRFLWSGRGDLTLVRVGEPPSMRKLLDNARVLAASPDAREILYVIDPRGRRPRVAIGSIKGDELEGQVIVFRGLASRAAVSPQGFIALSGRDRPNAEGIWVLEGGGRVPQRVHDEQAEVLAWSLDGSSIIYLIDDVVFGRDLRDGRTIRLTPRGEAVIGFAIVP